MQSELMLVGIDGPLTRHAGELAEELELRGYDAVHLASALALGTDTTLVTWDEDLKRAAAHSGCAVAPQANRQRLSSRSSPSKLPTAGSAATSRSSPMPCHCRARTPRRTTAFCPPTGRPSSPACASCSAASPGDCPNWQRAPPRSCRRGRLPASPLRSKTPPGRDTDSKMAFGPDIETGWQTFVAAVEAAMHEPASAATTSPIPIQAAASSLPQAATPQSSAPPE